MIWCNDLVMVDFNYLVLWWTLMICFYDVFMVDFNYLVC
jgi:hypothetical protein